VVDQRAFRVGLERFDLESQIPPHSYALRIDFRKGGATVDLRLALPQQIEIRPVDDRDPHFLRLCSQERNISRSSSSSSSASGRGAGRDGGGGSDGGPPCTRSLGSVGDCGRDATSASATVGSQPSLTGSVASFTASV